MAPGATVRVEVPPSAPAGRQLLLRLPSAPASTQLRLGQVDVVANATLLQGRCFCRFIYAFPYIAVPRLTAVLRCPCVRFLYATRLVPCNWAAWQHIIE